MTNTAEMTNSDLEAALAEAVEWSNWHFDDQNWRLAEQWHLRAVQYTNELERRTTFAQHQALRGKADQATRRQANNSGNQG